VNDTKHDYNITVKVSETYTKHQAVTPTLKYDHWKFGKFNKFAQSNLGRGPRRGAVARVRRKVPIGYNVVPQIRPQKYPFPWTNPQTVLSASSLDSSDLRCQTASGSNLPFCHNSLDRTTDRPAHLRIDRQIVHGKV